MPNNSFRFNVDTPAAYRIRQAALREGRTVADIIRRAVDQHVDTHTPNAVEDDCIIADEGPRHHGSGRMTGAYLSGPLASIVRRLADEQGRSKSNVVRGLLRQALRERGLLPSPSTPASAANDSI